jgi:hypothetical protein
VNQLRDTEACRGRTSVMLLWYCLRPSSRGAVSEFAVGRGTCARAELENRRIRPVVICLSKNTQP